MFYGPLGIYTYVIKQHSNVKFDIWEAGLPVFLEATSSNFREDSMKWGALPPSQCVLIQCHWGH